MKIKILHLIILLLTSSCAYLANTDSEIVPIRTTPSGALVEADTGDTCITPCRLTFLRGDNYKLKFSKEGYKTTTFWIKGNSWDGWLWGNIFLSPVIGLPTDFITGRAYDFDPEYVELNLSKAD